ncbi:MAG TPA: hypothetical protein VK932_19335 [Kofleriaceae bacterium]|nr:hypothetical protein [Kofleriaceae bacterium]
MMPPFRRLAATAAATLAAAALPLAACGATRVNVAPVQIQPIHMTIDVNLHDGDKPPAK